MKAKTVLKPPSFLNPLLSKEQFMENILNVILSLSRKTGLDQAGRYRRFFSMRLNSSLIGKSL